MGGLGAQLIHVLKQVPFTLLSLGYGFFFYMVGGLAFWTPTVVQAHWNTSHVTATLGFGIVTIISGIVGTVLGGKLMDVMTRRSLSNSELASLPTESLRAYVGSHLSAWLTLASLVFVLPAMFVPSEYIFFAMLFAAELLLFATTAPTNIAVMCSVPDVLRSQALAVNIAISHIVGDFPSPHHHRRTHRCLGLHPGCRDHRVCLGAVCYLLALRSETHPESRFENCTTKGLMPRFLVSHHHHD